MNQCDIYYLDELIYYVCKKGYVDIAKWFMQLTTITFTLNNEYAKYYYYYDRYIYAFEIACIHNQFHIAYLLYDNCPNITELVNWNKIYYIAYKSQDWNITNLITMIQPSRIIPKNKDKFFTQLNNKYFLIYCSVRKKKFFSEYILQYICMNFL